MIPDLLVWLLVQGDPSPRESLTPRQIFELSARAHLGGGTEVRIDDFRLSFNLVAQDEKRNVEFRAQHLYKKPDRVKTTVDDPDYGLRVDTGFDGRGYWLYEKDRGTIALSGREHRKDIAEIEERIALSRILAKTFSVKRFLEDLKDAQRLPDQMTADGERLCVQARALDFVLVKTPGIQPEIDVILYFDPKSLLLREIYATPPLPKTLPAGAPPPDPGDRSEKIVLGRYEPVKGVLLPRMVEIFAGKDPKKPLYEIRIGQFDFNVGLKEEDFQAP